MAAFAARSGYTVVGVFRETASGARVDRAERRKVMALAQRREIDVVLVTELSRWGRSTLDLLHTLQDLEARRVSVIAMSGLAFDLSTPHGRMLATVIAGIAEFERELIRERVRSGMAAAKARGKKLGRQSGQRPKSDRLAPKVLALVAQGRSYRLIGRELGLSKNTVTDIVRRKRTTPASSRAVRCSRSVPGTVLSCPFYGGTPALGQRRWPRPSPPALPVVRLGYDGQRKPISAGKRRTTCGNARSAALWL